MGVPATASRLPRGGRGAATPDRVPASVTGADEAVLVGVDDGLQHAAFAVGSRPGRITVYEVFGVGTTRMFEVGRSFGIRGIPVT